MIWPPASGGYPHLSEFGTAYHEAMGAPWVPSAYPTALVDLHIPASAHHALIRPSYKSLLNWGRNNLAWAGTRDIAEARMFHAVVAGRVTRSPHTWRLIEDRVQRGAGEILHGYLDRRLVSAAVFIDGGGVTIYWTGIYDRSLFPKPIRSEERRVGKECRL